MLAVNIYHVSRKYISRDPMINNVTRLPVVTLVVYLIEAY